MCSGEIETSVTGKLDARLLFLIFPLDHKAFYYLRPGQWLTACCVSPSPSPFLGAHGEVSLPASLEAGTAVWP